MKTNKDIRNKYIKTNERMTVAEMFGSDLFGVYLVSEIDKIDDQLETTNMSEKEKSRLIDKKNTLLDLREAYFDLNNYKRQPQLAFEEFKEDGENVVRVDNDEEFENRLTEKDL